LLWKESKLPISLEHFFFYSQLHKNLRFIVTGSCKSSHHPCFMRENFSKMKLVKTFRFHFCFAIEQRCDYLKGWSLRAWTMFLIRCDCDRIAHISILCVLHTHEEGFGWCNSTFFEHFIKLPSISFESICSSNCLLSNSITSQKVWCRVSKPGVHFPPRVHLPIWRGIFEIGNRREKHICMLFISKYLYIFHRICFQNTLYAHSQIHPWITMTKEFVKSNCRGACWSVKIMKGYMIIWWNDEGVHIHLSECWRGTRQEKGWESLV